MPAVAVASGNPSAAAATAPAGGEFDGVVRIVGTKFYGSGTLLSTGRHILTAAHVLDDLRADQMQVYFTLMSGVFGARVSAFKIHPGWVAGTGGINNDVAVLELSAPAPAAAQRYDLYAGQDEIGQVFTLVGYGLSGSGPADTMAVRRAGQNLFESDAGRFNQRLDWKVAADRQLVFDYDNGSAPNDAFGRYFGMHDLGVGPREAMLTSGDSGGPAFLRGAEQWLVAGINSYTARPPESMSDVDSLFNGSFGEFGAHMRVSAYRAWIDSVTGVERVIIGQAGSRPDRAAVAKTVTEGGVTWFLVEIAEAQPQQASVHYATRDGTATAGDDYVAAGGEIIFAPGQTWSKVMIETLPDARVEGMESFSLVLTDPKGGNFGPAGAELVASRTIFDNSSGPAVVVGVNFQADDAFMA